MKKLVLTLLFACTTLFTQLSNATTISLTDKDGEVGSVTAFSGNGTALSFYTSTDTGLFPHLNRAYLFFYDSVVDGLTFNIIMNREQPNGGLREFDMDFSFGGTHDTLNVLHSDDRSEFRKLNDTFFRGRWDFKPHRDGGIVGGLTEGTTIAMNWVKSFTNIKSFSLLNADGSAIQLGADRTEFNNRDFELAVTTDVPEPKSMGIMLVSAIFLMTVRRFSGFGA